MLQNDPNMFYGKFVEKFMGTCCEANSPVKEEDYNRLLPGACAFVNQITQFRADTISDYLYDVVSNTGLDLFEPGTKANAYSAMMDAIEMAVYAVIYCDWTAAYGNIKSESNDGIKVEYAVAPKTIKEKRLERYEAAAQFLAPTGLLFRGC